MKKILLLLLILLSSVISYADDNFNMASFEKNTLPILLKKDKKKTKDCEFVQDPCGEYIDKEYLKSEIPLFKHFLVEGGYVFPTKNEFIKTSKKYFPNTLPKPISRTIEKREHSLPADWKGENYYYDTIDSGVDIVVLRDEQFVTLPFSIGYFLDNNDHIQKNKVSKFLVSLNKYLFNNDHAQLEILQKEHYEFLQESGLDVVLLSRLNSKNKKRIEVKKIFEITNDNSTYKINCKMYKKLDASTIKQYFQHSIKEPVAHQIKSNKTPWSGCVQKGKIVINEKLYTFELNLGGFGYMHSKGGEGTGYNCYHIDCPEFKFDYGLKRINNPTYKSLYSFCKATGIKESEIRKLNPWINKDASNISVDAEIVVPISKEEK